MIPKLSSEHTLLAKYQYFLQELRKTSFSGEIRTDYASRLVTATDNSVYQVIPQAVVLPKSQEDIAQVFKLALRDEFRSIKFSPRGGGTGTNGQSLNSGIMVDCSKYMNNILEINKKEGWIRVQPGVVLDQLNEYLKPHGVFFPPTLSPSNRATLGGMINTDACGKGSRIYGRTSNHVLGLSCVLVNGESFDAEEINLDQLEEKKKEKGRIGKIYQKVDEIVTEKKELIEEIFPKMNRFMTGYNLAKVNETEGKFNLNYLITGSEGTLTFITEAKLKITKIPKWKKLIVVKYQSFDDALSSAEVLVKSDPAAIETIDEKILMLAREDEIYHKIKDFITDEGKLQTKTVNLVEFISNNKGDLDKKVKALCKSIEDQKGKSNQAIGYYIAQNETELGDLWNLRKKGVGLLGNAKGSRKPIAFVEDTAVPPENLAAYIREFRALLEKHSLEYGMFGHIDAGCLHVRPALDMKNPDDEKLFKVISDEVSKLVKKYKGVMWGEHGRGFRSEYTVDYFGEELYQDLRKIKEVFDPKNQLNPGKIVTPYSSTDKVVSVNGPLRGHFDRQIPPPLRQEYETTINCNGNGACFNYHPDDVMCPSSKITRDRIHSPKGRAGVMREWLRLLSSTGYDVNKDQQIKSGSSSILDLVNKWHNTQNKKNNDEYDFSHEVKSAMDGCLSCKACGSQCPVHVDVPDFKSKFLELYYSRYLRPLKDHFVAGVEQSAQFQAFFPKLVNWAMEQPIAQNFVENDLGMIDAPKLSETTVIAGLTRRKAQRHPREALKYINQSKKSKQIIILQDAFTSFYEANLVLDTYDFLCRLGFTVHVLPFRANGKPFHVKGFLKKFNLHVRKNVKYLRDVAEAGIPIIGIDPSIVLTYRDEYCQVMGTQNLGFHVQLMQEWLAQQSEPLQNAFSKKSDSEKQDPYHLFGHCTERTAVHDSQKEWVQIFQKCGFQLSSANVGCCGMAGTFGHEVEHLEESKGIYEMSWKKQMPQNPTDQKKILATGYSCRSQVKRFDGFTP
ncbi:MAG: FAD/FMN-containing dehydrogenase/Fe-S oxidoreductase, partial [bacterium]